MKYYVADTHALYWYLAGSPKLGPKAKDAFDEAADGRAIIYVSVIVLAELFYLLEKIGGSLDFATEYRRLQASGQFHFLPLQPDEVLDFGGTKAVPEMHDRIIAGMARRLNCACLTCDVAMIESKLIETLW